MRKRTNLWFLAWVLGALLLTGAAQAQIIGAKIIVQNTGEVVATYQGNSAAFSNDLYLDSPANGLGIIFNNHASPVGSMKSLGTFTAGTELLFRLHVNDTGNDFFTGPGTRNPDGEAHARVTDNAPGLGGQTLVEFEDLLNGPFNFNDLSFSFTNVGTTQAVPEPGALAFLLGSGGCGSLLALRRLRRR